MCITVIFLITLALLINAYLLDTIPWHIHTEFYSLLCVSSPVLYSTHILLTASQLTQGMLRAWSNMGLGGLKLKACKGSQQYQLLFLHFWFLELRWISWTVCKNQYSKITSKHTCAKAVWRRLLSSCNMWHSVSILSSK